MGSVSIVPLDSRHLELTFGWVNTPSLIAEMNYPGPVSREDHAAWYRRILNQHPFAIEVDGEHVGNCCLKNIDRDKSVGEIWIYIGSADNQRKGLGGKALDLLLDHAFTREGLERIVLYAVKGNARAVSFYSKNGFSFFDGAGWPGELPLPSSEFVFMQIKKEEWSMSRASQGHLGNRVCFKDEESRRFPSIIMIAAGSPCNLRCKGCPCTHVPSIRDTVNEKGAQEAFFAEEHYRSIVDESLEYKTSTFVPRIRISGYGEPLLNKHITKMIDYSCGKGIPTSLITNGLLLTEEISTSLLQSKVEAIEISVDAHQAELYETMRRGGNFARLVENVSKLVELRNRLQPEKQTLIMASAVNGPLNTEFMDEIIAFWKGIGVDHVSVRKFLTWGVPELVEMQRKLGQETYLKGDAPCPYPFERLMLDPAGWIRLCPYDDQKLIPDFGHISTTSIAEAWKSAGFEEVRACHKERFLPNEGARYAQICAKCEDRLNRSWTFNYLSIVGE